jgi:hypothetical protein
MQGPKSRTTVLWWWLAPIVLLIILEPPVFRLFGWILVDFLWPMILLVLGVASMARLLNPSGAKRLKDEFSEEEAAHRKRLTTLRTQSAQMELALRDLRTLRLAPNQTTRAKWAQTDLEEALRQIHHEMAQQHGALFLIEAIRWFAQMEPLLQGLHTLDETGVRHWLGRIMTLQSQGAGILTRLRQSPDAMQTQPGVSAEKLLGEALSELTAIRADLVTHRAELLVRHRPGKRLSRYRTEAPLPAIFLQPSEPARTARPDPETTLERLQDRLHHLRAQREVQSWGPED